MTKLQFLLELHSRLAALPQNEVEEHLIFYSEMIEDRVEDGISEEEAVAAIGSVDEIAAQILGEKAAEEPATSMPADEPPCAEEKNDPPGKDKRKTWITVLLIVGAPVWLSLLIVAVAVGVSLYIVLWALLISLWSIFTAFAACACAGVAGGAICAMVGDRFQGLALIGAGIACAGVAIFLFCGARAATMGTARLTNKCLKSIFANKEAA